MILFFLIGALALYDALVAWWAKRAAVTSGEKLKNGDKREQALARVTPAP